MQRNPHERKLFVGVEVENTLAKGKKTLFLAGVYSTQEAIVEAMKHDVEQIYLAANQSYGARSTYEWTRAWIGLLVSWNKGFVTIDVPLEQRAAFLRALNELDRKTIERRRALIQYSAYTPDVSLEIGTTYLKLDDKVESVSNPGVWVWPMNVLVDNTKPNFTPWQAYKEDQDV